MSSQQIFHAAMKSFLAAGLLMAAACSSPESVQMSGQHPTPRPALPDVVRPEIPADQLAPPDTSQKVVVPKEEIVWITQNGGNRQFEFNPRTDILFVVDNSDSMKSAQENLSRNINRFVEGFKKNRMIDFQIGVVSVWDSSERYVQTKKDPYAIGDLRLIKNQDGKLAKTRFVSRFKNYEGILASTLKIGVSPYTEGGPEVEEVFSPLSAALKKTGRGATNEGFFRDDAQLVVVLVTDADDSSSGISPEQMAQELFDFKGGLKNKVSAYGVLVKKSDSDDGKDWALRIHPKYHPECFDTIEKKNSKGKVTTVTKNNGKCTGFGPDRLEQFILAANADNSRPEEIKKDKILSLNQKDFGKDLAKIGSDIAKRALEKEIFLEQRPRATAAGQVMVRVRYGTAKELAAGKGQLIPQKQKGGWLYNPENNSVFLSGEIEYDYQEGSQFAVDLVPLNVVLN